MNNFWNPTFVEPVKELFTDNDNLSPEGKEIYALAYENACENNHLPTIMAVRLEVKKIMNQY